MRFDHPNFKKVEKALYDQGDLYTVADILKNIQDGKMQSFAEGDTWVVTEVREYPHGRNLEIIFVAGRFRDCKIIEDQLVEFCKAHEIDRIVSHVNRLGWDRVKFPGWERRSIQFVKELGYGRKRRRNAGIGHKDRTSSLG